MVEHYIENNGEADFVEDEEIYSSIGTLAGLRDGTYGSCITYCPRWQYASIPKLEISLTRTPQACLWARARAQTMTSTATATSRATTTTSPSTRTTRLPLPRLLPLPPRPPRPPRLRLSLVRIAQSQSHTITLHCTQHAQSHIPADGRNQPRPQ